MTKQATLHEAKLAIIRAHDALASINESGAYRDIVSEMRSALCLLNDAMRAGHIGSEEMLADLAEIDDYPPRDAGNVR